MSLIFYKRVIIIYESKKIKGRSFLKDGAKDVFLRSILHNLF